MYQRLLTLAQKVKVGDKIYCLFNYRVGVFTVEYVHIVNDSPDMADFHLYAKDSKGKSTLLKPSIMYGDWFANKKELVNALKNLIQLLDETKEQLIQLINE